MGVGLGFVGLVLAFSTAGTLLASRRSGRVSASVIGLSSSVGMVFPQPVQLDIDPLQHILSFLFSNDLVLSAKPLSKHFKQYVENRCRAQGRKSDKVDPSSEVPLWALPNLEVGSLTYEQKQQLMTAAAKGGCLQTLRWAREQGCPWGRSFSDTRQQKQATWLCCSD